MSMTPEQVADWMRAQGVSESTIKDEAGYIASKYADPDEDPLRALQQALPSYLQRTSSGGDRSSGGYSTSQGDPSVSVGGYTAPYRAPETLSAPPTIPVQQSFVESYSPATSAYTPSREQVLQIVSPNVPSNAQSWALPPSSGMELYPTIEQPTHAELNPPPTPPPPTMLQSLSTFEMLTIGLGAIGLLFAITRK